MEVCFGQQTTFSFVHQQWGIGPVDHKIVVIPALRQHHRSETEGQSAVAAWSHLQPLVCLDRWASPVLQPERFVRGQAAGTIRDDMTPRRLSMALTNLWLDNVVGWAERPDARPLPEALDLVTELFLGGAGVGR